MRILCLLLLLAAGLFMAEPSRAASGLQGRNALPGPMRAGELRERRIISGSTAAAFINNDFAYLEKWSTLYRTEKSRTSSGIWKLSLFYAGLGQAVNSLAAGEKRESAFREIEGRTARWAKRYPASPSAHIAHAHALIIHAWAFRGNGYASTVKQEAWAPFFKYIAMARQHLESHKAVAAADPQWYQTMLIVATAENWPRDQFVRLLDEALDREPLFYETYFAALEYLLPKWHGGVREIEAFATAAVKRTAKQEGRGMYARLYWYASQTQFDNDLFADTLAAWPRMKEGFEDVVARYPDAWNLNNYARFACLARDKAKTRELLKRTESMTVPEAWLRPSLRDQCSRWALR